MKRMEAVEKVNLKKAPRCMKLPLDKYQLLGVGIGSDLVAVLTILEKRLESSQYKGFSIETNLKRKKILQENSKVLINDEMREKYDEEIMSGGKGAEKQILIKSGDEVAALILLLEAEMHEECLELAYARSRNPPIYASEVHKEVEMVINIATLELASRLRTKRYFDKAAQVLEKRLKELSKSGDQDVVINQIKRELKELRPYRILDLLSRSGEDGNREYVLALLNEFIKDRGGLDYARNTEMEETDFRAFLRQIRKFLTVQEQIDLFTNLAKSGSTAGMFLASISLVASGFTQRKPEKITEALLWIEKIGAEELLPLQANIHLLLGEVGKAEKLLRINSDIKFMEWLSIYSTDSLAQNCIWCQEWLKRDVLPGYRDIEVEADLEAYFADREVVSYLDQRTTNRSDEASKAVWSTSTDTAPGRRNTGVESESSKDERIMANREGKKGNRGLLENISLLKGLRRGDAILLSMSVVGLSGLLGLILIGHGLTKKDVKTTQNQRENLGLSQANDAERLKRIQTKSAERAFIDWVKIKDAALRGDEIPASVVTVASSDQIKALEDEVKKNRIKGERLIREIKIEKFVIEENDDNRIIANVTMFYEDSRLNAKREVIQREPRQKITKKYAFVYKGGNWILK